MDNNLNEFYLSNEVKEKLKDTRLLTQELESDKSVQEIIGFTDLTMAKFYKTAYFLFKDKNYKDAANAFLFLANLNPQHAGYWIGLGMATQMCHDYETAIDAYELAACIEISNPVPYFYLAKCLFAIHERENSLEALNLAIEIADDQEEFQELKEQAEAAKQLLLDQF